MDKWEFYGYRRGWRVLQVQRNGLHWTCGFGYPTRDMSADIHFDPTKPQALMEYLQLLEAAGE